MWWALPTRTTGSGALKPPDTLDPLWGAETYLGFVGLAEW